MVPEDKENGVSDARDIDNGIIQGVIMNSDARQDWRERV